MYNVSLSNYLFNLSHIWTWHLRGGNPVNRCHTNNRDKSKTQLTKKNNNNKTVNKNNDYSY